MDLLARAQQSQGSARGGGSNSLSGLVSTLIPVLLVAVIYFVIFLVLRPKMQRVYNSRTMPGVVSKRNLTPQPSNSLLGWIADFRKLPDSIVLRNNSIDGYLFLRFLKTITIMCFVGCCIVWPVLFPINATAGGTSQQLDLLSMSNVPSSKSVRFYAHAAVAWVFLGFIMLLVARERLFFIGLRQAYFLSSFHAHRLSSRTVLFLSIGKGDQTEERLRQIFGSAVRKIWMVTDTKELEKLVEKRDKAFSKAEGGQNKLIHTANKKRITAEKKGGSNAEKPTGAAQTDDGSRWTEPKDRPTHKLTFLIGKKVDTINWTRENLPIMEKDIDAQRTGLAGNTSKYGSAAFVEFANMAEAQRAFQYASVKPTSQMHPRYFGPSPSEIVWKNLAMSKSQRSIRNIAATIFICLLILFWAIPVAVVGSISNINYLTTEVHFLSFINKIPHVILGVVTGLLPVVALAVLMSLVPVFCKAIAKLAGEPTLSRIELKCQAWYFAFQVIQVFLITTLTSAASAVAAQVVKQPSSALPLLAENLPKASNFYIDFFILQGLAIASSTILNIGTLVMISFVGKYLDNTPRKAFKRWTTLGNMNWGKVYPEFTNLAVISITYCIIAPLVLGFATVGFLLIYWAFRYNFIYSLGASLDMKGTTYCRALKQMTVGVYLAIVCLAGLFGIGKSWGPLGLIIGLLVVVVVFHVLLDMALKPLENGFPLEMIDSDGVNRHQTLLGAAENGAVHSEDRRVGTYQDGEFKNGIPDGQPAYRSAEVDGATPKGKPVDHHDAQPKKDGFVAKLVKPMIHKFYLKCKPWVDDSSNENYLPEYTQDSVDEAYINPALYTPIGLIWIAKDPMGLSKRMAVENREAGLRSTDDGAFLDEKNNIQFDRDNIEGLPVWEKPKDY